MQKGNFATFTKKRRKKCASKFSSSKQLLRARMEKMLCRIKKGNNTETLKALVYNDIGFHSYIVGNETMGKVSEIV